MDTLAGPEWWGVGTNIVVAAGTLAVAATATCVAVADGRRRDAERLERESSQARLVTCEGGLLSDYAGYAVLITNHSGLPVLSVEIRYVPIHRTVYVQGAEDAKTGLIEPGCAWHWDCPSATYNKLLPCLKRGESASVTFRLVDASGLHWERTGNGQPSRVMEADATGR
ncbi:hypothetical protein [Streptomyces cyaneofuscatus]|uniref:hypothetical protein n=1 Tax=Streptomyces cyaneofuscatus TaxID=66883 RepID=UPI00368CFADA